MQCPFLVLEPSDFPHTNVSIKMQSDLKKLSVTSNNEIGVFGDLEILQMIEDKLKDRELPIVLRENIFNQE